MMFQFLGVELQGIHCANMADVHLFLRSHPQPLSGYTASTLCAWTEVYRYGYRFVDDGHTLLISCVVDEPTHRHLL
jgi:hypothetical protein